MRAIWPVLDAEESRVLDQAIGLAMYDPERYAAARPGGLARRTCPRCAICPRGMARATQHEVAEMMLAAFRGFLLEWRTSGDAAVRSQAGLDALARALDREEAAAG